MRVLWLARRNDRHIGRACRVGGEALSRPRSGERNTVARPEGAYMWDDDAEPFVDNTEMLAELLSTVAEDYCFDLDSALMRSTRATPRPSATRRGKPRSTASAARAGSSRRMTHRMPGSSAVALRMSHRGHGIRRTRRRPRRPRIEELPPRRKWGGEVARGVDNHSFTPPVAVGTCNGQPAQPFIELVDAVHARLGATEVFLETGIGTCSVCWCFGKYLMPKAPALAPY